VLLFRELFRTITDLIYPHFCVICHTGLEDEWLCTECQATAQRIQPPFCHTCSRPFFGAISEPFRCPHCEDIAFAFDCAVSPYLARGAVRELIHRLKYAGQFHLRTTIANWLWAAFSDPRIAAEPFDAIVPVPLHPVRTRERGYDQVSALAEIVARRANKPLLKCLRRHRYTQTQTVLDRDTRARTCTMPSICARVRPCWENVSCYSMMCLQPAQPLTNVLRFYVRAARFQSEL
jgi:predicted amidophosphoribosyltransferase